MMLEEQTTPGGVRFDEVDMTEECASCTIHGACCKVFAIPLTEEEAQTLEVDPDALRKRIVMIRRKKDGSCWYLHHGTCRIHHSRPLACREYTCMGDPRIKALLRQGLGLRKISLMEAGLIIKRECGGK